MSIKRCGSLLGTCVILNLLSLTACSGTVESGSDSISWQEFEATVYREPDTGIYIVDGDEPVYSIEELRAYYDERIAARDDAPATIRKVGQSLIVNVVNGRDDKWSDTAKLNITYCVDSFTFAWTHAAVVNTMNAATAAWESAARVNFVHVPSQDAACSVFNNSVVFNVRLVWFQPYVARAFLPSSTRFARELLIDASAFGNIAPWTLEGVIRHELGHALGFRHEHARPESGGQCKEPTNWRPLSPYDSASVMHYPQCNGTAQGDLVLTSTDRAAAASLYGAP